MAEHLSPQNKRRYGRCLFEWHRFFPITDFVIRMALYNEYNLRLRRLYTNVPDCGVACKKNCNLSFHTCHTSTWTTIITAVKSNHSQIPQVCWVGFHSHRSSRNKYILRILYKTLVCPHLEYCTPVWSPHYVKDEILLERVQHQFTRMVPGLKDLP